MGRHRSRDQYFNLLFGAVAHPIVGKIEQFVEMNASFIKLIRLDFIESLNIFVGCDSYRAPR